MILNTGDVPNVYEPDEKAEITEQVTMFINVSLRALTEIFTFSTLVGEILLGRGYELVNEFMRSVVAEIDFTHSQ